MVKHGRLDLNSLMQEMREMSEQLLNDGFVEIVTESSSLNDGAPTSEPESQLTSPKVFKRSFVIVCNLYYWKQKRKAPASSPVKTKRVKFDMESSKTASSSFVRLCHSTFINALWYNILVDIAKKRINDASGMVLDAVLSMTGFVSTANCRTLVNSFQISHKLPAGTPILVDNDSAYGPSSRSPLVQYLERMVQELPFFIKAGDQTGGQFYVDFTVASDDLVCRFIEAYISNRFGQPSARIFKILLTHKYLEEKTISKIAMISAKETKERLYALFQNGFIHLQVELSPKDDLM